MQQEDRFPTGWTMFEHLLWKDLFFLEHFSWYGHSFSTEKDFLEILSYCHENFHLLFLYLAQQQKYTLQSPPPSFRHEDYHPILTGWHFMRIFRSHLMRFLYRHNTMGTLNLFPKEHALWKIVCVLVQHIENRIHEWQKKYDHVEWLQTVNWTCIRTLKEPYSEYLWELGLFEKETLDFSNGLLILLVRFFRWKRYLQYFVWTIHSLSPEIGKPFLDMMQEKDFQRALLQIPSHLFASLQMKPSSTQWNDWILEDTRMPIEMYYSFSNPELKIRQLGKTMVLIYWDRTIAVLDILHQQFPEQYPFWEMLTPWFSLLSERFSTLNLFPR